MGKKGAGGRGQRGGRAGAGAMSGARGGAAAPRGDALLVRLVCRPSFDEAVAEKDPPAEVVEDSATSSEGGRRLRLGDWGRLTDLLEWFKVGAAADQSAHLAFSPTLTSEHRAELHRLAEKVDLKGVSHGVGESRCMDVYLKTHAPEKEDLSAELTEKSRILYSLAKQYDLKLTRDEAAEMLRNDALTPKLKKLWESQGEEQQAIGAMCHAASNGQLQQLQSLLASRLEAVRKGKRDVQSGLTPLHCAAAQGQVDCLKTLLEAGAPLDATDRFGQTPLQASRKFEQNEAEAVLLRAGSDDPEGEAELGQSVDVAAKSQSGAESAKGQGDAGKEASPPATTTAAEPQLSAAPEDKTPEHPTSTKPEAGGAEMEEERPSGLPEKRMTSSFEEMSRVPLRRTSGEVSGEEEKGDAAPEKDAEQPKASAVKEEEAAPKAEKAAPKADEPAPKAEEPAPIEGAFTTPPEGEQAAAMDPQQFPGGWHEPSQPPVVASQVSRRVPAVVGGRSLSGARSLSGHLPESLLREYSGPANLRDPRAATRGQKGASAVALGRRIIENAAAEMQRYGSAGLPGEPDKVPYTEPSQPPLVSTGKLSGVPNVVGGRGTTGLPGSSRVQMTKPKTMRSAERQDPAWKINKRIDAWMESAPEEHSSLPRSKTSEQDLENSLLDEAAEAAMQAHGKSPGRDPAAQTEAASPGKAEQIEPQTSSGQDQAEKSSQPEDARKDQAGPQYQDPRGKVTPTQPPVVTGLSPRGIQFSIPEAPATLGGETGTSSRAQQSEEPPADSQQPDPGAATPLQQMRESVSLASIKAPYEEGTQPPGAVAGSLSHIPAVVGGRGLPTSGPEGEGRVDAGWTSPKQATYGEKGPSATDLGKRIIEDPVGQMERYGSAGRSGDLDVTMYAEPSQPPKGPLGKLSGIPNAVGGRGLARDSSGSPASSPPPVGPSRKNEEAAPPHDAAPGLGSRPAMARISEEQLPSSSSRPSFEFPQHEESPLSSSSTAAAFGRPRGLGKTTGLPQKRTGAGKSARARPATLARAFSSEAVAGSPEGSDASSILGPAMEAASASTDKLAKMSSSLSGSVAPKGKGGGSSSSWLDEAASWAQQNNGLLLGGAVVGGALVAGLCWLRVRK